MIMSAFMQIRFLSATCRCLGFSGPLNFSRMFPDLVDTMINDKHNVDLLSHWDT
jgi:hypothetical protein